MSKEGVICASGSSTEHVKAFAPGQSVLHAPAQCAWTLSDARSHLPEEDMVASGLNDRRVRCVRRAHPGDHGGVRDAHATAA